MTFENKNAVCRQTGAVLEQANLSRLKAGKTAVRVALLKEMERAEIDGENSLYSLILCGKCFHCTTV